MIGKLPIAQTLPLLERQQSKSLTQIESEDDTAQNPELVKKQSIGSMRDLFGLSQEEAGLLEKIENSPNSQLSYIPNKEESKQKQEIFSRKQFPQDPLIKEQVVIYILVKTNLNTASEDDCKSMTVSLITKAKIMTQEDITYYLKENTEVKNKTENDQGGHLWAFETTISVKFYFQLLQQQCLKHKSGACVFFNLEPNLNNLIDVVNFNRFRDISGTVLEYGQISIDIKSEKYYIQNRQVEKTEDFDLDFKQYNIKKTENLEKLTQLVSAFLNRDRIPSADQIVGRILLGVPDDNRIIYAGYMRQNDIENFFNEFSNTIRTHTVPDVQGFVQMHMREVILYCDQVKCFWPIAPINTDQKKYMIEIEVERVLKHPNAVDNAMVAYCEQKQNRIYYQRLQNSNRKLTIEEILKYVPQRIDQREFLIFMGQQQGRLEDDNRDLKDENIALQSQNDQLKRKVEILTEENEKLQDSLSKSSKQNSNPNNNNNNPNNQNFHSNPNQNYRGLNY